MLIDSVTKERKTRVRFRIRQPQGILIELLIPLAENDSDLRRCLTELPALNNSNCACECSAEACLECKIYQAITLIRRSVVNVPESVRSEVALSAEYGDGTTVRLGTVDEIQGAAARLIESIQSGSNRQIEKGFSVAAASF
ncbi:MAG TPA: hypothetical protein VEZ90_04480 [Blastocatellia bacterium]|nr:hypothetical protein [Blastocatellia bacterium]